MVTAEKQKQKTFAVVIKFA